jgi:hypothetical protein
MYWNIVMLIFLLLTAITITFVNQAKAGDMPNDKTQVMQMK